MGFWSKLKERRSEKKEIKKHYKENKSTLTFSKEIKGLSKKYKKVNEEYFEDLENILIKTDMGIKMVLEITKNIRKKVKKDSSTEFIKELIAEEIYDAYDRGRYHAEPNLAKEGPTVFLIMGVNGVGKTTSIAKMANYYKNLGKKVLIVAGDTFRAGAVEQLEQWVTNRLTDIDLLKPDKPHQDPASVVFDGVKKAVEENYDMLLIDTAGRLQNKTNLMQELEKIFKIIKRTLPKAPHECFMVIDANTGQNGVVQAKSFSDVAPVTGIILTKMDSTSKGGIALCIKDLINIPVKFVGFGESVGDLKPFNLDDYVFELTSGFMEDDNEN
ncbi:signal recognition particle-docking protein FtsY [Spiroplasma endosymbiont of Crioceris asparagi]|uniref:signal recognition particle-docking protein FtsY n=1 Tax=Spiroplasma endosymbiont of Crioceris asparagi TaxID=3066286 RepID=UPI0030D1F636